MRTIKLCGEQTARGPLILVNAAHPLADGPVPQLAPADSLRPGVLMERQAARLLDACVRTAGGWQAIVPVSGWRSLAEQRFIWADTWDKEGEDFTRKYVALPRCSEHQTGLAIDVGEQADHIDFIRPRFPEDGPCGRFGRLAADYGFLRRYRREKEAVTGIAEEPWHFRYVGAPHARLMEDHGLCLEEYGDFLRDGPKTCTLSNGRRVTVSYLPCPGGETELELPENACFQVSGHNDGGFIVTVWEAAS